MNDGVSFCSPALRPCREEVPHPATFKFGGTMTTLFDPPKENIPGSVNAISLFILNQKFTRMWSSGEFTSNSGRLFLMARAVTCSEG